MNLNQKQTRLSFCFRIMSDNKPQKKKVCGFDWVIKWYPVSLYLGDLFLIWKEHFSSVKAVSQDMYSSKIIKLAIALRKNMTSVGWGRRRGFHVMLSVKTAKKKYNESTSCRPFEETKSSHFSLKALDKFSYCQRPVFSPSLSQHTCIKKQICKNVDSIGHRSCKRTMKE